MMDPKLFIKPGVYQEEYDREMPKVAKTNPGFFSVNELNIQTNYNNSKMTNNLLTDNTL